MDARKSTKKSSVSTPTVKDMLAAGSQFGHQTKRWDPNYRKYIYAKRGNFHIIDLEKTHEYLNKARQFLTDAAKSKTVLMVGTKRQARDIIREEAVRAGVHFVVNRWVGGTITNFDTIEKGIKSLRNIEEKLSGDLDEYSQKELSVMRREWGRLSRLYGGIKFLQSVPEVLLVVDVHYEKAAIREAKRAGITIVALVDSNSDPSGIDYVIPANDDAIKSIKLLVSSCADAILEGNKGKGIKHLFKDFSTVGIREVAAPKEKKQPTEKKKTKRKVKKVAKKTVEQKKKASVKPTTTKKKVVKKARKKKAKTTKEKTTAKKTKKTKKKTTKKTTKKKSKTTRKKSVKKKRTKK
jgi:small subunit ribosomal protein S2